MYRVFYMSASAGTRVGTRRYSRVKYLMNCRSVMFEPAMDERPVKRAGRTLGEEEEEMVTM